MKLKPAELMRTYLNQIVVDGRLDLITQLAQPDMIDEANQVFGGPPGREGLVAHVKGFRRNISELELTIDQIVAAETEVMAQWSFKGRHTGPWLGRTPTGLEISATVFSVTGFGCRPTWTSRSCSIHPRRNLRGDAPALTP